MMGLATRGSGSIGSRLVETPEQRAERERLEAMLPSAGSPASAVPAPREALPALRGAPHIATEATGAGAIPNEAPRLGSGGGMPGGAILAARNKDMLSEAPRKGEGDLLAAAPRVAQSALPGGLLGSAMRRPFDYDAARAALMPPEERQSDLRRIAQIALPALMGLTGNQQGANQFTQGLIMQRQQNAAQRREAERTLTEWQRDDYEAQRDSDYRASDPFTIGRDRVMYDPATGQASTIFDGPEDFELYAQELDLQPGSPEYFQAVEDYVLRSSGPSAHDRDLQMDDRRTDNDVRVEGARQDNRIGLEGVRQSNRVGLEGTRQGNRVTLRNMPPQPRPRASGSVVSGGSGDLPVVDSPEQARGLPPGTRFRTRDGRTLRVPRN